MSIWLRPVDLTILNQHAGDTMVEHLGIIYTDVGADF